MDSKRKKVEHSDKREIASHVPTNLNSSCLSTSNVLKPLNSKL